MTGLEPFVAPLVSIMIDVLKDSGKKEGEGLIARWMNWDVCKDWQDVAFKAAGKYIENYERHGVLKVLGMREPVKLDEVFTTVQLLGEDEVQQFATIDNEDVYSFSHLTLQEYLTARYIYANDLISQMVENYLTNDRWREVFLLTSGLMVDKGSDRLLLEMNKVAKQYASHSKVKQLLKLADQVIASSSGILKPTAKRTVAIVIINQSRDSSSELLHQTMCIYRGIDRGEARENARAITSVIASGVSDIVSPAISSARNRSSNIAKDKLEQLGIITTRLGFSQFLIDLESLRTYLDSTDITRLETEKFIINDDEFQALQNYLYSIDLLLKCKQEAARLSPATWDAIEAELLLPPDD